MKRILFISPRLGQGGAERQSVTIARLLKKEGYDVEFLCYSYGDFYEYLLKEDHIPVYWSQHNYLIRLATCIGYIRHGKYDVVISFLPTPSLINGFAAMLGKRWKVITGERSSNVMRPHTMRQRFSSWLRRYSDYIVCNSYNAKALWEELFPNYKEIIKTIYNAVTLDPISSNYQPLEGNKLHICVPATVSDIKNPIGLINALLLMNPTERDKIVINWYGKSEAKIGDTSVYDEVRKMIALHQLEDVLKLHDAIQDISEKMMASDFVALFSRSEGLPNAICEGMMMGKPIIMTRVSDYNILVEEPQNGYLCDWNKPENIKNVLLKATSLSSEEIVKMGAVSKHKARLLFSEDKILGEWLSIIE